MVSNTAEAFALYSSTSSSATITYYQAEGCVDTGDPDGYYAHSWSTNLGEIEESSTTGAKLTSTSGELYSTQLGSYFNGAISSFKVTY